VKLYIGQQMILPVLESLTLHKARSEAAATLTATILLAAADTYIQKLSLALGDPVRLLDDDGKEAFLGSIHVLERTPERVILTAYDRGIFLTRNELRGAYFGESADIVEQVAEELGIAVGTVETGPGMRFFASYSGESAFSILRQTVGEKFEISIRDDALCVTKHAYIVYVLQPSQVLEVSGTASLAHMVNRCTVVDRKNIARAAAECPDDISAYGQFQTFLPQNGDDPAAQAKAALTGRSLRGEVTVMGNLNYRCGCAVELHRSEWGLDGVYAVTAAEHRWEGGIYTTAMQLEFIRK